MIYEYSIIKINDIKTCVCELVISNSGYQYQNLPFNVKIKFLPGALTPDANGL